VTEYDRQTIELTRAAAMEKIARALIDFEDWSKESCATLSRKIAHALGFK
jgi:hypothetical protein